MTPGVRSIVFFALLVGSAGLLASGDAPEIEVTDRYPGAGVTLAPGQPLYLRLAYRSDRPLRFQLRGPESGQRGAMMNPAPSYPAGTGEALVWLAYRAPQTVREINLVVFDEHWAEQASIAVPVAARWGSNAGQPVSDEPPWVMALDDRQQQMTGSAMGRARGDTTGMFLIQLAMLSVPGYMLLQFLAWRRMTGAWRLWGRLPLLMSVPLLAYTLFALLAGSNLWPLMLILLSPLLFLYLALVFILRRWNS